MGSPSKEGSRSPEGSAGNECPFTGRYSRHLLLPAVWQTNTSTASWCGASPEARRQAFGQHLASVDVKAESKLSALDDAAVNLPYICLAQFSSWLITGGALGTSGRPIRQSCRQSALCLHL